MPASPAPGCIWPAAAGSLGSNLQPLVTFPAPASCAALAGRLPAPLRRGAASTGSTSWDAENQPPAHKSDCYPAGAAPSTSYRSQSCCLYRAGHQVFLFRPPPHSHNQFPLIHSLYLRGAPGAQSVWVWRLTLDLGSGCNFRALEFEVEQTAWSLFGILSLSLSSSLPCSHSK